jgi:hypothetical protein
VSQDQASRKGEDSQNKEEYDHPRENGHEFHQRTKEGIALLRRAKILPTPRSPTSNLQKNFRNAEVDDDANDVDDGGDDRSGSNGRVEAHFPENNREEHPNEIGDKDNGEDGKADHKSHEGGFSQENNPQNPNATKKYS